MHHPKQSHGIMKKNPGIISFDEPKPVHGSPVGISDRSLTMEKYYETLLNSANFGIIASDVEGYVVFVNTFARSLLDIHTEISNKALRINEIDKNLWKEYAQVIQTGRPQLNVPAQHNETPLVSHRLPITLDGRIIGVMSIFKHLETYEELANDIFKLKEYTHEIEAIIESSYDGIYVTDGEAKHHQGQLGL